MNKDTLTTILGVVQAAGVTIVSYVTTAPPDETGSRWTNPLFYLGLGVAVLVAVKAYFTKGIETKV
jgi:predicted membrane channel-forming protein YqfA (hemolysin III family)